MFGTSLTCYWTFVGSILASEWICGFSAIATVAFFLTMHFKPEMRKDAPANHMYLMAGGIAMLVFIGSFTGLKPEAEVLCTVMAAALVMAGMYGGSLLAKSTTNREYLIRKLFIGVFAAFLICIVLMVMFMSSDDKKKPSTGLFVFTFVVFMYAALYILYTTVFIILPGMVEDPQDYILGVTRVFTQQFILLWALLCILYNMIKNCICGPSDK